MLATVLASVPSPARATDVFLVPLGGVWSYLDDGSDAGSAWISPSFDDSGWATGPAQLGYGDGDEATVVSFGPDAANKYVTTYFRHAFEVSDPNQVLALSLRLLRDDGAIVHLNGTEVFRSNMPPDPVDYLTHASSAIGGSNEPVLHSTGIDPLLILPGSNVLAVEIHQANATSSDISFDLDLLATIGSPGDPLVTRGPYLQRGTPTSAVVRWRTDIASDGRVRYGTDPNDLSSFADGPSTIEHAIELTSLSPETRYYYSIGTPTLELAGNDPNHYLRTSPIPGTRKPIRLWVVGDSGEANQAARDVRDDYLTFTGSNETGAWLMLGDNAYSIGTDAQYQAAVFDTYPQLLRNTFLWPAFGNHDAGSSSSSTQTGPYYASFTLPTAAESGGLASGTEAYYAFDYGNVHFLVLDSQGSSLDPNGAMLTWAESDLAATTAEWVIAYWHHPPYTKGSHDSDSTGDSGGRMVDMRENALPILEGAGVDLVLAGHSHVYERSVLIDGHYGHSTTFNSAHVVDEGDGCLCAGVCPECPSGGTGAYVKPYLGTSPHDGAVYSVVGSSSKATGSFALDHPVMIFSLREIGAMVLDVDGPRLDATWIERGGTVRDRFTLVKGGDADGDAVSDAVDNCSTVPNAGQEDTGGILGPFPDGTGDACQCGDLNGDGIVDAGDVTAIQLCLDGSGACGALCDTDGNATCEAADIDVLEVALEGGPDPVCSP